MKILLIGEYSRLHNSLKEGLESLNHNVTIVGTGDKFKNFPVDLNISPKIVLSNSFLQFLNKISIKLFKLNLESIEMGIRFYILLPKLKGFDIVQLINSNAIETFPSWSIRLFKKLFSQNSKSFLLICGEDTPIIDALLKNNLKYSILTPYFENKKLKPKFTYSLKYSTKKYRKLYNFITNNCSKIIVSDLDYQIPMSQTETNFTFIPNPINTHKIIKLENKIEDKIIIFHGINSLSSIKKGNIFFEEALKIIQIKYANKIEIIIANDLPYAVYQKLYDKAHIVLDQIYSYDQGYNALEAMAKGKVVFTGAEKEFEEYYKITSKVNINALPDVNYLVNELSILIENPKDIIAIGNRARAFIEKEHDYILITKKYLDLWNDSIN